MEKIKEEHPQVLLILKGPPACGKTTFATEFIENKCNWIRVNYNELCLMIGKDCLSRKEKFIKNTERIMVEQALRDGHNVIVDDINLDVNTLDYWKDLAKLYKCEFKEKEFIIPYKQSVKRDFLRADSIGEDIIRMYYRKYYPSLLAQELDEI
ncbi:MAG: AAA family ATPase [Bacteroidales bacterium]|nr:AAA family ATPase [Candidatus Scybalousia scybalohippi]